MSSIESDYSGILLINRRLARTTNDQELYLLLNEELEEQVEKRKTVLEKLKRIAKNVNRVSAFNLILDLKKSRGERSPYAQWRLYVDSLRDVELILIAIDDADFLSIEAIQINCRRSI